MGEKVVIEVGVTMFGPFTFPENTYPISAILWLCIPEEERKLKKPFKLIIPHFISGLTLEKVQQDQICFAKAMHNYTMINQQEHYNFQSVDTEVLFASSGSRNYGVLQIKHCCYYCLIANQVSKVLCIVWFR